MGYQVRSNLVLSFVYAMAVAALVACSNPMGGTHSSVDPGHAPGFKNVDSKTQGGGSEFVASSSQMKKTVGGHFVYQGALASPTSQVQQTSKNGNFKLFSNVQGQFVSGE